jgi:glycine/D-amino acid oxidase-like deaminating enzyme
MTAQTADVVICGAGMAGIAAAFYLAVQRGVTNILLADEREPLTLTSDKGTEAYRNWWPGPDDTMVRFMNRSIDLLEERAEESDNFFQMNRRGYLFLTADPDEALRMKQTAAEISQLGAGPLRHHPGSSGYIPSPPEGFHRLPTGADVLLDPAFIGQQFPFITDEVVAGLHVRRCGWLNARRLGHWLLQQAQARGVQLVRSRVERVAVVKDRVHTIHLQSGDEVSTGAFVIAAGPLLKPVGAMLGLDLPVANELHGKIAFRDHRGIVPREAPLMIWNDPLYLPWTAAEREQLAASDETRWLLDEFPAGVHFRPRGDAENPLLLIIWTYETKTQEPVWPPNFNPYYREILLRGLARMIPGLSAYFGQASQAQVDGGYYCKTPENRPLIGPLPVPGAYVIGALSGYGVMGSQAAGELLAAHVTKSEPPDYASAFLLSRYEDPAYQKLLTTLDATSGQL